MGHHHHTCCNKQKVKRGLWTPEEDAKLINYVATYGHGCWSAVPRLSGLHRCGKSCRLRWINYLRPDLKRGGFSKEEAEIIVVLHKILGNKWSQIAKFLPGRTDNEVKNFWNSSLKKRLVDDNGDICRDFADSSSSSSVPTHVMMNPNSNFIPFQFQGMPNFHPNYPPPMQPATSYAPPPLYNLTPQNLPPYQHYQYPIIQQHPNFMSGPNPPNPVFMPSNLEAQADNNDNNNYNMNCYDPNPPPIATETAAPFADAAQPPLCEGLAGIDIAGFMEEPPSPMGYLESLLADIESPILTPALPSSSTPPPCSSGSSFLDDAAFDSLWAAQP